MAENGSGSFAQAILGNSVSPSRIDADRAQLEWLAEISQKHADQLRDCARREVKARIQRESFVWLAEISTAHDAQLRRQSPSGAGIRGELHHATSFEDRYEVQEVWISSKHPRLGGPPNAGWWAPTGGSGHATVPTSNAHTRSIPNTQHRAAYSSAAAGGAASVVPPTFDQTRSWSKGADAGSRLDVGRVVGPAIKVISHADRNAKMVDYWSHLTGAEAMPRIWDYELEKRVRSGTLSRLDADNIKKTAAAGAQAQGFLPTGTTSAEVHKSAVDFLGQAEAVYFARKRQASSSKGAYQNSGGRVFPTKKNSGLDGYALRQEQEKFFERGLSQGKTPEELRGQAHQAGVERTGKGLDAPLVDPEVEEMLKRVMQKNNK
jgi:hypothetical protein